MSCSAIRVAARPRLSRSYIPAPRKVWQENVFGETTTTRRHQHHAQVLEHQRGHGGSRGRSSSSRLRAPRCAPREPELAAARVVSSLAADAAGTLRRVSIDVPGGGCAAPGQFVQVKVDATDKPAFMAIASPPPSSERLELLVSAGGGETAKKLASCATGESVLVSAAMGDGFRLGSRAPASETSVVFVFATGSGLSPIKALIEASGEDGGLDAGSRKKTTLLYGCKSPAHLPFIDDDFAVWRAFREKFGIDEVVVACSGGAPTGDECEQASALGLRFEEGYVQHVFKKHADDYMSGVNVGSGDDVAVVLCGQKEMCGDVTAAFDELGISQDKMLFNF